MNIYKISQNINNDYDTYDAMVVYAENVEQAIQMHPDGMSNLSTGEWCSISWVDVDNIDKLKVELVGVTDNIKKPKVILSSFNAG